MTGFGTFRFVGLVVVTAVWLVTGVAPTPALAKNGKVAAVSAHEQAKNLSAQALVAYERGKFAEAAELYKIAYRLDPTTSDYLFGVGKAEQKAGRWAQAAAAFEQLLAILPASDPLAGRARKALETVKAAQSGQAPAAAAPAPVEATKPPVEAAKSAVETARPAAEAAKPVVVATPAPRKVEAPKKAQASPVIVAPTTQEAPAWPKWTATAVTAVAAIGAGFFAMKARQANSDANAFRTADGVSFDPSKIGESDAKEKVTDINSKWTTAASLGAVAVVGAGVSAWLWLRTPGPAVATDGRQVYLAWRF